ncbi:MAG: universal stress protein, partial [SAR202 cluster bacterium]|nr:universal stress protein [SAR202 cluster bacterium]
MFKKLLVPLDGSDIAERTLPYALLLATRFNASLSLLTVIDPGALDVRSRINEVFGPWEAAQRVRLEALSRRLSKSGVEVDVEVEYGTPSSKILDLARSGRFDLIVMASRGKNLLGWAMLGSVAYSVLHASSIPVFIVAPEQTPRQSSVAVKFERIVVPLDGTKAAESSLPYAEGFAQAFSVPLRLVRVFPDESGFPKLFTKSLPTRAVADLEKSACAYLDIVAGRLAKKGFDVTWECVGGSPAPRIIESLRGPEHNLVII